MIRQFGIVSLDYRFDGALCDALLDASLVNFGIGLLFFFSFHLASAKIFFKRLP